MKLQYLSDARDAFKWDILHWVCTQSTPAFSRLVYVPLLTPPDKPNEGRIPGRIPHQRFPCRDFIRAFLASIKTEPRTLERISALGTAEPTRTFQVSVFAPGRFIGTGARRREYWSDFDASKLENSVVFFDPDNGFETKTQHGQSWIRHSELKSLFAMLPETSIVVVYQHRPQRQRWENVFTELEKMIDYAHTVAAAYEPNLAFVAVAGNRASGQRATAAIKKYAEEHTIVKYRAFRTSPHLSSNGVVSAIITPMRRGAQVGDANATGQVLVQKTNQPSPNHPFAKVWILRCPTHGTYRANSCDFHIRKCPHEGGKPG